MTDPDASIMTGLLILGLACRKVSVFKNILCASHHPSTEGLRFMYMLAAAVSGARLYPCSLGSRNIICGVLGK